MERRVDVVEGPAQVSHKGGVDVENTFAYEGAEAVALYGSEG